MHHALRLLRDHGRLSTLLYPSAAAAALNSPNSASSSSATGVKQPYVVFSHQEPTSEVEAERIPDKGGLRVPTLPQPTQPLPSGSGSVAIREAETMLRPPPRSSFDISYPAAEQRTERRQRIAPPEPVYGRGAAGRLAGLKGGPKASGKARKLHASMQRDLDAGLSIQQARLLAKLRPLAAQHPSLTPAQLLAAHDTLWAHYAHHNVTSKVVKQSMQSWAMLLKFAERKDDAKTLGLLGTRALAWAKAQPAAATEFKQLRLLLSNLQTRFSARTDFVFKQDVQLSSVASKDDFGRAAQLRMRLPPAPNPNPDPRPSLPPHIRHPLPSGQVSSSGVRSTSAPHLACTASARCARLRWPRTHLSSEASLRQRSALEAALSVRKAEQVEALQRQRAGVLPPSTLARGEHLTHDQRSFPQAQRQASPEALLRAWQDDVAKREEVRAKIQADLVGRVARQGKSVEANVPPAWLVLGALRARAERGEAQKALNLVQAYLNSFVALPEAGQASSVMQLAAALHNSTHTFTVTNPHLPPRGASLLNLVLRAHVCAGASLETALDSLGRLTGHVIIVRNRSSGSGSSNPNGAGDITLSTEICSEHSTLVPDEQTLLLLFSFLRPLRNRVALGLRLAHAFTHTWSPRVQAASQDLLPSSTRQLFLGTRTARELLRWAINTNDSEGARKVLQLHQACSELVGLIGAEAQRRVGEATKNAQKTALWKRLCPRQNRGEPHKWSRTLARLRDKGWISEVEAVSATQRRK